MDASYICVGAWALSCARLLPQSYQYPNLSEGADRVGGQLRGDKECPFSGVTNYGSLEEGAGKRCSEYLCSVSTKTFQKALTASVDKCAEIKSAPSVA